MKAEKMKVKVLFLALCLMTLAACKKDKFNTKPTLTFKSVSPKVLSRNQLITFKLSVTDKEGDINDTIWYRKVPVNCALGPVSKRKIPDFITTASITAEFDITLAYGNVGDYFQVGDPQCNRNDTCVFKFWMQDKAKNKSDTVSSPTIVIIK